MDQPADQQGPAASARRSGSWDHADRGAKATAAPFWPQALGSVLSFSKAPFHYSQHGRDTSARWAL